MPSATEWASRWTALIALLLLVPAPSLGVFVAMMWEPTRGTTGGQAFFAAMKVWILVLPLAWTLLVDRRRDPVQARLAWDALGLPRDGWKPMWIGAGLGIMIAAIVGGTYWLVGDRLIDPATMQEAAMRNGIGEPSRYLMFTAFLAIVNAWLEEYVWRWFVVRKCEILVGGRAAIFVSAAFFTLHHIFALVGQTSWQVTALACTGVFIGGCVWSWCLLRFGSIWPGYVSHVIVDVAVFTVGWMILFEN